MDATGWFFILLLGAGVGLGVYVWLSRDSGWSSGRSPAPGPVRPRLPSGPTSYRPPAPGSPPFGRVRFRSSQPAPPGWVPPRPPVSGGADPPHVVRRASTERCSYCTDPIGPRQSYVRCREGHIAHEDCMAEAHGTCPVQYCGASVA